MATLISDKYAAHKTEVNERWDQLKANEEEPNRIFAEIYGMVGEVPIEVEDKYVSVTRIFDTEEEIPESFKGNRYVQTKRDVIVSLISYAVGCMLGRYSLDVEGLVLADAGSTLDNYLAKMPDPANVTFMPCADGIVELSDEEWSNGDATALFEGFVRAAYGDETLEENLRFVADALEPGAGGDPRDVIRRYFFKEFFADHCKTYKKRPIYWLFDSGKKGGFRALVYLHRWRPDTPARLRTDHVHPRQERLRSLLARLEEEEDLVSGARRVQVGKRIKTVREQLAEASAFEERLHHLADQMPQIDLDDGVKVNYARFQNVLAKIK